MFLPDPAACGQHPLPPAASCSAFPLDPAGRRAVLIGRNDASLHGWDASLPRTPLRLMLGRCFVAFTGMKPVSALADARLERLRVFACMIRRGDARAGALGEALRRDGYNDAALRQAAKLASA